MRPSGLAAKGTAASRARLHQAPETARENSARPGARQWKHRLSGSDSRAPELRGYRFLKALYGHSGHISCQGTRGHHHLRFH